MKKAVLFDLDGTLLPMDFDRFMHTYFKKLSFYFRDLIDPETLPKAILSGTKKMVEDNSDTTNEQIFMTFFSDYYNEDINTYTDYFERFYKEVFDEVQEVTWQSPEMKEVVAYLKSKKIPMVIATNPLFPMEANLRRIKWAGLKPDDFVYITSLETSTKCKPNPNFFVEVLEKINYKPNEVLMVGNDYIEDGIATKIGIETYMITDCALNDSKKIVKPNHESDYQGFLKFIKCNF